MRHIASTALIAAIAYVAGAQEQRPLGPSADQLERRSEFVWLNVPNGRVGGRAYINVASEVSPVLAIVLHGDLLEPTNSYHYGFARTLAAQTPDVVVVGLLRPGYSDERRNRSDGEILNATGDNYTADVVEGVALATGQLQERYEASAAVLIGHSGGSAIAALVLGRYPGVADAALLVACPCDLPAWRSHMMELRPNPVWRQPHEGLSPLSAVSGVRPTAIVELMVGDEDEVTPPEYSQVYAAALRELGVDASVTILPGLGHNILQRPPVINTAKSLLMRVRPTN